MILFILATFLQEKRIHLERILTYLRKGKDQGVKTAMMKMGCEKKMRPILV